MSGGKWLVPLEQEGKWHFPVYFLVCNFFVAWKPKKLSYKAHLNHKKNIFKRIKKNEQDEGMNLRN